MDGYIKSLYECHILAEANCIPPYILAIWRHDANNKLIKKTILQLVWPWAKSYIDGLESW